MPGKRGAPRHRLDWQDGGQLLAPRDRPLCGYSCDSGRPEGDLAISIVGHRGKLLDAIAARRGDADEGPTSTLSQLTRYR